VIAEEFCVGMCIRFTFQNNPIWTHEKCPICFNSLGEETQANTLSFYMLSPPEMSHLFQFALPTLEWKKIHKCFLSFPFIYSLENHPILLSDSKSSPLKQLDTWGVGGNE
jgi:hypothetical protein